MTAGNPTPNANALQVSTMQPLPMPLMYQVGEVSIDGKRWIAIKFDDPTGSKVVFFEPDAAKELADKLRMIASGLSPLTVVVGEDNISKPIHQGRVTHGRTRS